jgi:hypothetical protein
MTVDTLANGGLRVTGPAIGAWDRDGGWRLLEDLRIGEREGEGPAVFQQVWDIETDPAGRIYVLDRQAMEVRVFDAQGIHVRTFGGEGEGPGEFRGPFGMIWDRGGHLWVVDVRLGRYSVFDTAGVHLEQYPRRVGGYSWPWPATFDSDGLLLERSSVAGVDPDPLVAFRPDGALVPVDTFPAALAMDSGPGEEAYWDLRDEEGIGAIVGVPFGGNLESVLDYDGGVWMGLSSEYRLVRRNLRGDTLLVVLRNLEPPRVSDAERDRAIEGLDDHLGHPGLDLSRIPSTKPFFQRLIPDRQGRLWVLREGEGSAWLFDVFGPDGGFLGSTLLPVAPETLPPPVILEDGVLLVTADSLGVQSVSRLRISREG